MSDSDSDASSINSIPGTPPPLPRDDDTLDVDTGDIEGSDDIDDDDDEYPHCSCPVCTGEDPNFFDD